MNTLLAPGRGVSVLPLTYPYVRPILAASRKYYARLQPDHKAGAVVVSTALVLAGWNLLDAPAFQDDEGTYTAQAMSVLNGSLAPYTYWYDHPPMGWLQLAAFAWIPHVLGLGQEAIVGQMRYVVAFFFVISTLLVYLLARRLELRITFAVLAALLFCMSPLSLVLGRQVFMDNIGVPWLLLAFYLVLSPQLKLWHHIGAGACFAVAVLSKETLAIFGPALLVALLHRPYWQTRFFSLVGFLSVGGLLLGFFPLLALLRGELLAGPGHVSLQEALAFQLASRPGSGSFFDPTSDRFELVMGWMYYDKYLILAGVLASLACLVRRGTRWIPAGLLLFFIPVAISHGYLPAMYIIGAVPFLALAMAAVADLVWRKVTRLFPATSRGESDIAAGHQAALGKRIAAFAVTGGAMVFTFTVVLMPQWLAMDRSLFASNANSDWRLTLEWAQDNIPEGDTALVPYSMWQDMYADGRHDPWTVIALEKMDLDTDFAVHHPEGWRSVDWIIEGPSTLKNIDGLQLENAGEAFANSRILAAFGEWKVREVLNGREVSSRPAGAGR